MEVITFNELRQIKDLLPDGSMEKIANELDLTAETVRNAFGGSNYDEGSAAGLHIEQGPDGGLVHLDHPEVLQVARRILQDNGVSYK